MGDRDSLNAIAKTVASALSDKDGTNVFVSDS